jgi:hypothetical protein
MGHRCANIQQKSGKSLLQPTKLDYLTALKAG